MFAPGESQFSMHLLGAYCAQSTVLGKISLESRDLKNRIRYNLVAEGDVCNHSSHQWLQGVNIVGFLEILIAKRHLVFYGATVSRILWQGVSSFQILKSLLKAEVKDVHPTLERVPCDNPKYEGTAKGPDLREEECKEKAQFALAWMNFFSEGAWNIKKPVSVWGFKKKIHNFLEASQSLQKLCHIWRKVSFFYGRKSHNSRWAFTWNTRRWRGKVMPGSSGH